MDSQLRSRLDESFDLIRRVPLTKLRVIDRSRNTVKDLRVGSTLNYGGIVYLVTDKYVYYEKKKDVIDCVEYQITDVLSGDIKYLEYSEDDTVEIYITTGSVSTKEISKNLPRHDHEFIQNEVKDFRLPSLRMDFYYDDDWKSRFVRDGQDITDNELVRMVEFEGDDEKTYLTFEFWEDDSMEAFLSKEIKSHQIEVLSL